MIISFYIIALQIAVAYIVLIFVFHSSAKRKSENLSKHSYPAHFPTLSVIIAFRNEENTVELLLKDLLKQSIRIDDIILVNDHSDDSGPDIVRNYSETCGNVFLINLPEGLEGKKAALSHGVQKSKGEVLLFTDADCRLGEKWAETMLIEMIQYNTVLVAGPVDMIEEPGLFQELQNLEFLSLIGSTAGGFAAGIPFMCNGANLAVKRDIYIKTFNTEGQKFASGDDVFLLHSVKKDYDVNYCENTDAIVHTLLQPDIKSFLNQRIRWASKAKAYKDPVSLIISLLLLLVNLIIIILFHLSLFYFQAWILFIFVVASKLVVDTIFMKRVLKFYNKEKLMKHIFILQILYPIYIVYTGVLGLFYKPIWKGRKINSPSQR